MSPPIKIFFSAYIYSALKKDKLILRDRWKSHATENNQQIFFCRFTKERTLQYLKEDRVVYQLGHFTTFNKKGQISKPYAPFSIESVSVNLDKSCYVFPDWSSQTYVYHGISYDSKEKMEVVLFKELMLGEQNASNQ